jgi:DNA-binding MarR family transcriptional regulator
MADAIDVVFEQWRRVRPDVDIWPIGVLGRIVRLARVLEKENKKFLAEHDLEPFEFDVLTTLSRSGEPYELTASELLKAAMVTSGAITNRIDRMEGRGLVERVRDLEDRRSVRVRLTPHGREVLDGIFGLHIANTVRMLEPLDMEACKQVEGALRILLESFGDVSLAEDDPGGNQSGHK